MGRVEFGCPGSQNTAEDEQASKKCNDLLLDVRHVVSLRMNQVYFFRFARIAAGNFSQNPV
jgi:hypothetical protein